MATLVLTAVGGAVGGPVGAMLGGLLGRAADGALLHHDPARDYQAGLQRVGRPGPGWRDERVEVAAALSLAAAKAVAGAMLARAEAGRVRRMLRLGPAGLAVRPGDAVRVSGEAGLWRVASAATERMVTALELVPAAPVGVPVGASGGRALLLPDRAVGRTVLHLFELPPGAEALPAAPRLYAAASGGPGWKGAGLLLSLDEGTSWQEAGAVGRAAVTGLLVTPADASPAALFDEISAPVVALGHAEMMLHDADDAALDAGANLALVGDELVQFGRAAPLGGGRWRLGRLLRGRRGTIVGAHAAGSRFVLLEADAALALDLPMAAVGRPVRALASGPGDGEEPAAAELGLSGASVLPPSPVHLRWHPDGEGGGTLSWVRRSRAGLAWVDGADAPLAEEREWYAVTLVRGDLTVREAEVAEPRLGVSADERSGGPLRALVRQRGTAGPSAPAVLDF